VKVSRQQAEQNRERIVEIAGGLFRAKGFDGVGIAELMQAAGLTHGGFYGNFASKEQLEIEAARRSFVETRDFLDRLTADSDDPLAALVEFYLSPGHRDDVAGGCSIAALSQDAQRAPPSLRVVFEDGIRAYLSRLTTIQGGDIGKPSPRAMATLSTMVGALGLARTVTDPALSDSILEAAKTAILTRA
jgi:TetR/AcrR family transcriptional regulator, transcriptional repressor for nem operon